MGMWTTISIRLLLGAPRLSDSPAGVLQTGDSSLHNWQDSQSNNWSNTRMNWFIIHRQVAWESLRIIFTNLLASNVGIDIGGVKAKWLDKEIGCGIAIQSNQWLPVTQGSTSSSSVPTYCQQLQMKNRGTEIHTNVYVIPLLGRGFINAMFPLGMAHLRVLSQCCIESSTIEDSLVCHGPFPKRPFRQQITDMSNSTIH